MTAGGTCGPRPSKLGGFAGAGHEARPGSEAGTQKVRDLGIRA